jgi:pectinesterase
MWVRNVAPGHGFVFNRCAFHVSPAARPPGPFLARTTAAYPDSEVVLLDCALGLVNPRLWSLPAGTANTHDWEYRSTRLPEDAASGRGAPAEPEPDAATVARYRDPAFVLDGWSPSLPITAR